MLGASQQQPALIQNRTVSSPTTHRTIVELFENQVLQNPHSVAIIFENDRITYEQLNVRANKIAHYLIALGVKEEVLVPICIERGIDMVAGMLGILKAGAAYVPVDPEYPAERINYMMSDTGTLLVLTSKLSRFAIKGQVQIPVVEIDGDWPKISRMPVDNVSKPIQPYHLAYVIYTSGSTGNPKGVMIEHRNVFSFIWWCRQEFSSSPFNIVYATTSICFDLSIFEIFYTLSVGKPIRILDSGLQVDQFLGGDNNILLNTVPVVIDHLLKLGSSLEHVSVINMAGEPVPLHVLQALDTDNIEVRNLYGPTEDTTYSTIYRMQRDKPVLIGKPILNSHVRIVAENKGLALPGEAGEICIGGAGVARGYLNRPELTKEKFITDPFTQQSGGRLYKTGDVGRWLPDGNIEYLGRIDTQVKIRGYRIELGEIETALSQSGFVQQAIVVAKEDGANKRLSCYYRPTEEIVRQLEKQLYIDRVKSWKEIYEVEYRKTENEKIKEEFNLIGWNDSFTGAPVSEGDMRLWLQDIVDVILSENPGNVVEIGCGTGLIFYQLAGKVKKYIGCDFSQSSITQIRQQISKGLRNYGDTEWQVSAAHEVFVNDQQVVDTVILNSIIQYFPGEAYLNTVIEHSLKLLKGNGRVIIGDVRDKRLLDAFITRLQLQKMQPSQTVRELKWSVEAQVLNETELCISPEYFYQLKTKYPEITHVEIKWKHNSPSNEMALYRYTVVLYVGIQKPVVKPTWQVWNELSTFQEVTAQLRSGAEIVAISDVPNPRLSVERSLNDALNDNVVSTIGEVIQGSEKYANDSKSVWEMLSVAKELGYYFSLFLDEDPLKVNVSFEKTRDQTFIDPSYFQQATHIRKVYTNVPLYSDITSMLEKDILALLQKKLPEFMVPTEFIALEHLPLTINGKVDRMFLAAQVETTAAGHATYKAPGNAIEASIAAIWQNLMGVEQVGINDNFFHLGGHSLLAVRIISAIRSELAVEVTLKDLVMYPTISELARQIHLLKTGHPEVHANSKLLIPLKTSGNKIPLYIVSGGGGTVFAFKRFVDMLDEDQPVYGLQQPTSLADIKEFPGTIEGIASKYIDEILLQNPTGAYALSGHCVGGIIAFEMAKQLEAQGKDVRLLVMFDTILPKLESHESRTSKNFYQIPLMIKRLVSKVYLKLDFEMYLIRNHTRQAIRYKLNSLKSLLNKVYPYKDDDLEMKVYKTLECNFENASSSYNLTPFHKHMLIFYAKDHYYFLDREQAIDYKRLHMDEDTKNRWREYAPSVTIFEVAGEHSTLFDPVHGENFARLLQQQLNESNSIASPGVTPGA